MVGNKGKTEEKTGSRVFFSGFVWYFEKEYVLLHRFWKIKHLAL